MAIPDRMDERLRVLNLVEGETTDRIGDLAGELWGTPVRWPGRIARSGPHALFPCGGEPPADRVIGAGDTVTAHFGPLLVGHGTDYTRTVVLGDDPAELRLREDLPAIFAAGRAAFHAEARITGRQLYAELGALAAKSGWSLGGRHTPARPRVGVGVAAFPPEAAPVLGQVRNGGRRPGTAGGAFPAYLSPAARTSPPPAGPALNGRRHRRRRTVAPPPRPGR
ncbi:M24 family metallopeptidase [Streptomyces erythrochromogenes]|uniref:M24 family metallopeptidase n=1 Tax=Streptomyces erythrochromogenes TaxID=285574 RepID=UPI003675DCD2